ncbi:11743_t:CDS:10 [Ambispora leptoticha]|uniref:11743_t:CDS:1 n=1 Tax=Ambispora leptoticha TaxID=144679 RepID=A0A9N8ZJ99_9GLOM|nr:11743_t:CDS:10 [Ambispora leptoticha]
MAPRKRNRQPESESEEDKVVGGEELDYEDDLEAAAEWERKRMKKPGKIGAIAESGVLDTIELVNFMCHKFVRVKFGPKINFIIGHNGSGKSAILTGITVCLGGKANMTNRATNLKSLIREGARHAYRHDVYGDTIIIERRITREGTNGYRIKNSEEKLISTKREELTAILDHMMIQVDNPMNVLSQDSARQFLHSSSPEEKYKGTQLTQLSEDYELIRDSINTSQRIIKKKKEILPELHRAAKDAEDRYKNMQKARELELILDKLKNEMAWAQVEEVEQVVQEAENKRNNSEKRVNTTRTKFDEANQNLQEISQENEEREINETIIRLRETVNQHQQKIEEETRKLELLNGGQKLEEARAEIEEKEKEVSELKSKLEERRSDVREAEEAIAHAQRQKDLLGENLHLTSTEIGRSRYLLEQLHEKKENRLKVFGYNLPQVVDAINRETRFVHKPVGPLGMYVQLLRPEWAKAVESIIGSTMVAFSVQNHADRNLLSEIMKRYNCKSPIIVGTDDPFDYTNGEPSPQFLTILRVLQFDSEQVKRVFINDKSIESTILIENRSEADEIMYNHGRGYPHNVSACYTIDGFKIGHRGGGYSTQAMRIYNGPSRFTTDIENEIREAQTKLNEAINTNEQYKQEMNRAEDEYKRLVNRKESLKSGTRELFYRVNRLEGQIQQMRDRLQQYEPANIAVLEEAKKGAENEIEMYKNQYTHIENQRKKINEEQRPLILEFESVHRRLSELATEHEKIKIRFEEKVTLRMESENVKNHWELKLAKEQKELDAFESQLAELHEKLEETTRQAESYCAERVQVTMKPNALDRKIRSIQTKLREREKEQGASLEEIASDLQTKRDTYKQALAEIANMDSFIEELKYSLKLRMRNLEEFRTFIAIRAKQCFQYQLSKRGYTGKLLFDHQERTLNLRVNTEVQVDDQTETATEKDPKSLSGGEKSFSTICLLLALWEAMGCPIRCLDEFDVFMDAVNRRISMRMMIETARESDCIQYILITPQDASSVSPGPDVFVHRLHDPERGQGTLIAHNLNEDE